MKTYPSRTRSIAAAVAAAFVTTVLVGTLVESFEPAQLNQLRARAGNGEIVALERQRPVENGRAPIRESHFPVFSAIRSVCRHGISRGCARPS